MKIDPNDLIRTPEEIEKLAYREGYSDGYADGFHKAMEMMRDTDLLEDNSDD